MFPKTAQKIGALDRASISENLAALMPGSSHTPIEGAQKNKKTAKLKSQMQQIKAGEIVFDAKMVESKPTGKEIELWAAKAERPKNSTELSLTDVHVKFYGENGVVYDVVGQRGGVVAETYQMWIRGHVVMTSSNHYLFKTESIDYNPKQKLLHSNSGVTMEGVGETEKQAQNTFPVKFTVSGQSLSANLKSNIIEIKHKVTASRVVELPLKLAEQQRAQIKAPTTLNINSDQALFSGKTSSVDFRGHVIIDAQTTRITGTRAEFHYSPTTDRLESILVAGGIRLTDTDRYAISGSLSLSFQEDKLVFKGSPKIVQGQDELVGDEIVLMNGGKKVQVINAKALIDPSTAETMGSSTKKNQ